MINLNTLDAFSASEASSRWGFTENYVRKEYKKNSDKFLEGSIRLFGSTYIITREGMEHLTGVTEEDANSWIIWHEKNDKIDFEKRIPSEIECRDFLSSLYESATNDKNYTIHYSQFNKNVSYLNIPQKGRYYFSKYYYFKKYQKKYLKEIY